MATTAITAFTLPLEVDAALSINSAFSPFSNVDSSGLVLDVDEFNQHSSQDEFGAFWFTTDSLKSGHDSYLDADFQSSHGKTDMLNGGLSTSSAFSQSASGYGSFEVGFGYEQSITAIGDEPIIISRTLSLSEFGDINVSGQRSFKLFDSANDRVLYESIGEISTFVIEFEEYTLTSVINDNSSSDLFYSFMITDIVGEYDLLLDWDANYSMFLPEGLEESLQIITMNENVSIQPLSALIPEPTTYAISVGLFLFLVTYLIRRKTD